MFLLDSIRRDHPEAVVRICKGESNSQKVKIDKPSACVILKGENLSPSGEKRCDCIIIFENDEEVRVAILELKSKTLEANKVVKKLSNCYRLIQRMLQKDYGAQKKITFRFATYSGGGRKPSELKTFGTKKISGHRIQTLKYNQPLDILF